MKAPATSYVYCPRKVAALYLAWEFGIANAVIRLRLARRHPGTNLIIIDGGPIIDPEVLRVRILCAAAFQAGRLGYKSFWPLDCWLS